jgi:hypothetical protein
MGADEEEGWFHSKECGEFFTRFGNIRVISLQHFLMLVPDVLLWFAITATRHLVRL